MAHRKIDIDIFEEDRLNDEDLYDPDPRSSAEIEQVTTTKVQEVRALLNRGDSATALSKVLIDAPFGLNAQNAKSLATSAVLDVLNSCRLADIPSLLKNLDEDQQDALMKYIYKGMAMTEGSSNASPAVLLNWHEKLVEVAGIGCIVRIINDHRTV